MMSCMKSAKQNCFILLILYSPSRVLQEEPCLNFSFETCFPEKECYIKTVLYRTNFQKRERCRRAELFSRREHEVSNDAFRKRCHISFGSGNGPSERDDTSAGAGGAVAESRKIIGTTTFWGMLTATLVGVAFIPPMFAVFQKTRETVKNGKRRKK